MAENLYLKKNPLQLINGEVFEPDNDKKILYVRFSSNKTYHYKYSNICILLKDASVPEVLLPPENIYQKEPFSVDLSSVLIFCNGSLKFNVRSVEKYCSIADCIYMLIYEKEETPPSVVWERDISFKPKITSVPNLNHMIQYLLEMASHLAFKLENGETDSDESESQNDILRRNLSRAVNNNSSSSLMSVYLGATGKPSYDFTDNINLFIFPFGANKSQVNAVMNAIKNQCSVIEGPPGTGKTQTILNIIANLLIREKTALIVSNNNSALINIIEKLTKNDLSFLAAFLGSNDNKENFVKSQSGSYPNLSGWKSERLKDPRFAKEIKDTLALLLELFEKQEQLAKIEQQISEFQTEYMHFQNFCAEFSDSINQVTLPDNISFSNVYSVWHKIGKKYIDQGRLSLSLLDKIIIRFYYRVGKWSELNNSLNSISRSLFSEFYPLQIKDLAQKKNNLESFLHQHNLKAEMDKLTSLSLEYLRGSIFTVYSDRKERPHFDNKDCWSTKKFLSEYPIILSTTYSSVKCVGSQKFDILIMDEASQVDIVQGAMALSASNKAVIVGDTKQLPTVITGENIKIFNELAIQFNVDDVYKNCLENSFLASFRKVFKNAPYVILKEHYRCHPDIIEFCNAEFYHNELVVMTHEMAKNNPDALLLFRTQGGHHMVKFVNKRQTKVTEEEIWPALRKLYPDNEIGVIAPYNNQVDALKHSETAGDITVATVHKFQGQEKEAIVFVSTDDKTSSNPDKTSFLENAPFINVAVSRAKNKFWLVASDEPVGEGSLFGRLIHYIQYKKGNVIDSNIRSCFDKMHKTLYSPSEDSPAETLFKQNVLLDPSIVEIFQKNNFSILQHYRLYNLFKKGDWLNEKEIQFIDRNSHSDFLIYNLVTHRPVFAIEIDGVSTHDIPIQSQRDRIKDAIFAKANLPLYRFRTDEDSELTRLHALLRDLSNLQSSCSDIVKDIFVPNI